VEQGDEPFLDIGLEIDEEVAANEDVEPGERGIPN
jgi:hypothetical protein